MNYCPVLMAAVTSVTNTLLELIEVLEERKGNDIDGISVVAYQTLFVGAALLRRVWRFLGEAG